MKEPKCLWAGEINEYRPFRHRKLRVDEYMFVDIGTRQIMLGRDKRHPGTYAVKFRRPGAKEIALSITEEALYALDFMRREMKKIQSKNSTKEGG